MWRKVYYGVAARRHVAAAPTDPVRVRFEVGRRRVKFSGHFDGVADVLVEAVEFQRKRGLARKRLRGLAPGGRAIGSSGLWRKVGCHFDRRVVDKEIAAFVLSETADRLDLVARIHLGGFNRHPGS